LREDVLKDDGVRNADGLEVLHGTAQVEGVEMGVAGKLDPAHLYHRAFLDVEVHLDGGGRMFLTSVLMVATGGRARPASP